MNDKENLTVNETSTRWISFGLLSAGFLSSSLIITGLPLIILNIESDFAISHSLAGVLITILMTASGLGRFFEGVLVDRKGKIPSILTSGLLFVVGSVGFGFSVNYAMACIFVFFLGLANGFYNPLGFSLVSHIFSDHRGKIIGLYDSVFPISALVAYGVKSLGIYLGSWRYAILLIGSMVLVSFSSLLAYTTRKIPEYLEPFTQRNLTVCEYANRVKHEITHSSVFLHVTILIIPASAAINGLMQFLPPYLVQSRGLTSSLAGLLYMLFMGISILGKQGSGWLIDEYSTRSSLIITTFIGVGGLVLLLVAPTYGLVLLGIVILSPARGGIFTLMHAHLLGELPDSSRDLLYGFYMVIMMIAGSTGPLIVGLLVDRFGFFYGFLFLTTTFALVIPLTYLLIGKDQ